ncbi:MAG TPA: hypothetical protein DCO79_06150 [Spirochaeta sp.]|nr:hypothetical protein [Spirochaeta sp.]
MKNHFKTVRFNLDFMNTVHYILFMPKLIPQLEEHIINTAEKLFITDGFDSVSMRRMANDLNIAVGTLYNYFPNKAALFFSIMDKSWNKTIAEVEKLIRGSEAGAFETRRAVIEIIYRGIKDRGAFARKTFDYSNLENHSHKLKSFKPDWQHDLIKNLTELLKPLGAGFSGTDAERTVQSLLASIRFFISFSESDDEAGNIDFLLKIAELN